MHKQNTYSLKCARVCKIVVFMWATEWMTDWMNGWYLELAREKKKPWDVRFCFRLEFSRAEPTKECAEVFSPATESNSKTRRQMQQHSKRIYVRWLTVTLLFVWKSVRSHNLLNDGSGIVATVATAGQNHRMYTQRESERRKSTAAFAANAIQMNVDSLVFHNCNLTCSYCSTLHLSLSYSIVPSSYCWFCDVTSIVSDY